MTQAKAKKPKLPRGVYYARSFISKAEKEGILGYLHGLNPLWEARYSKNNPPPEGEKPRNLLRPVYWLGNWQFACLDYYHPPKGILNRCVKAEPYPTVLAKIVARIEERVRELFTEPDLPKKWHLNTCLINFYGSRLEPGGQRQDLARVGEHRDYEPGPVASLSIGERALFQFVSSSKRGTRDGVVLQQWLEEGALQVFGGRQWKDLYFHRVQRVENKGTKYDFKALPGFETRRVNFTFRYVPDEHVIAYSALPEPKAEDIRGYMAELAKNSEFFAQQLGTRSGTSKPVVK